MKTVYARFAIVFVLVSCTCPAVFGQESFYEKYKYNSDTSISFIAAWRLAISSDVDEEDKDLRELVRFIGFVEGSLALDAPAEWRETLLSRQLPEMKRGFFVPAIDKPDGLSPDVLRYVTGFEELNEESNIVLQLGNGQFDTRVHKEHLPYRQPFIFNVEENLFAVGVYEAYVAAPFEITLIDISGETRWSNEVSANDIVFYRTGSPPKWNQVSFAQSEDKIFVFGIAGSCLYIEAFDKVTGKKAFRFNSLLGLEADEETGVVQTVFSR